MVLLDGKASRKNLRCRRPFDIAGVKTMALI
jgi:hypothetical protein